MNIKLALAAGSVGLMAYGTAFAHEMDTDQDGLYSMAEMLTEYADLTEEQYGALDTNNDGAVDADELAAAIDGGVLPAME